MLILLYALGKIVFGILAVTVATGLTLAVWWGILAGLGAVLRPVWGFFIDAWEARGTR